MTTHTLSLFSAAKSLPSSSPSSSSPSPSSSSRSMEDPCAFCNIVSGHIPAFTVYEDEACIAFLDILPLRRGHTLVIPRKHVPTLSDLEDCQAEELARALVRVTRAVGRAMGERLQVITNQVYAQVVPHVHFHIVPAPTLTPTSPTTSKPHDGVKTDKPPPSPSSPSPLAMMGIGHGREELDEEEAVELVKLIRAQVERLCLSDGGAKL